MIHIIYHEHVHTGNNGYKGMLFCFVFGSWKSEVGSGSWTSEFEVGSRKTLLGFRSTIFVFFVFLVVVFAGVVLLLLLLFSLEQTPVSSTRKDPFES